MTRTILSLACWALVGSYSNDANASEPRGESYREFEKCAKALLRRDDKKTKPVEVEIFSNKFKCYGSRIGGRQKFNRNLNRTETNKEIEIRATHVRGLAKDEPFKGTWSWQKFVYKFPTENPRPPECSWNFYIHYESARGWDYERYARSSRSIRQVTEAMRKHRETVRKAPAIKWNWQTTAQWLLIAVGQDAAPVPKGCLKR